MRKTRSHPWDAPAVDTTPARKRSRPVAVTHAASDCMFPLWFHRLLQSIAAGPTRERRRARSSAMPSRADGDQGLESRPQFLQSRPVGALDVFRRFGGNAQISKEVQI